ncbi:MAG TPA: flippase [Blastocatellia bacterium]|nr:flippase [Blastocatellia bacterium]
MKAEPPELTGPPGNVNGTSQRLRGENPWGRPARQFDLVARNLSMDYLTMGVELVIGLVMLPFNLAYLGAAAYGLLVLISSVTRYFSFLNLGYGVALVRFVAEYRARRDSRALNQVISTLFFVFIAVGLVAYGIAALLAVNLEGFFNLTVEQAAAGRQILLIVGLYIALGFPFSIFGGVVNGFQRQYLNGIVAIVTEIVVAALNVAVLLAGYGLVELVAATTLARILSYAVYMLNAYRVFPLLRIRLQDFRRERLREVTGFSAFIFLIDIANKLNYSTDAVIIGVFMSTAAIAVWAVAQRLFEVTQRLTGKLNGVLFPVVVDNATLGQADRLRLILVQGTRLSLAMVLVIATGLILLAHPFVLLWVGPDFLGSVPIIYILAAAVVVRVGNSTATTVLKGAGQHRLLAFSNLATAIANVGLSIVLVRDFGLIGVALGTLIPLTIVSVFFLFPAACQRAELPVRVALKKAVWPAVWPAVIMTAFLVVSRNFAPAGLAYLALQSIAAALLYTLVFLRLAIDRQDRRWYLSKATQLLRPHAAPAI